MWASILFLNRSRGRNAFTIVELLIVIVVIAILAAITIVAYNGIQDRARASAASSSSSQAAKKIKVWQVDNEATSPTCAQFYNLITNTTGTSCSFDYKDTNYQYTAGTNGGFCVTTTVVNKSYKVSESSTPQSGGCSGHGQGGVAAVTNLVTNPNGTSITSFGWAGATNTRAVATDGGYSGQEYIRASFTGSGGGGQYRYSIPAAPDTQYTASAWVRASRTVNILPAIEWKNSSGTSAGTNSSGPVVSVGTSWTRVSVTGTAPSTTASITFTQYINGGSWANSDYQDVDAYMVTEGSSLYNFADGNSPNWAWNGTANNATSTGPPL